MATETTYDYTIATDVPAGKVAAGVLDSEIRASAITIALKHVLISGPTCSVVFKDALPAADKTVLDNDVTGPSGGLIGAHAGVAIQSAELVQLSSPSEPDGKPVFVASPSTEGWMTWITSHADDLAPSAPASGRGDGQALKFDFTAPGVQTIALNFLEPTELHDGQFFWPPADWDFDDEFTLSALIPATVPVVNGGGTGNCNLVAQTGYNVIVPASGDGTHDVDLSVAQPVAPAKKTNGTKDGYWDVDHDTGIASPSASPGAADWHLLDVPVESFFIKRVIMGNPLGIFDIDVYKAEWISQTWTLQVEVVRASAGAGKCGGWLMLFRESST